LPRIDSVRQLTVRTFDDFEQVAEVQGELVGVIRGTVKEVVCGQSAIFCSEKASIRIPLYAQVGYLLGLRVCPWHRYGEINPGLHLLASFRGYFLLRSFPIQQEMARAASDVIQLDF